MTRRTRPLAATQVDRLLKRRASADLAPLQQRFQIGFNPLEPLLPRRGRRLGLLLCRGSCLAPAAGSSARPDRPSIAKSAMIAKPTEVVIAFPK